MENFYQFPFLAALCWCNSTVQIKNVEKYTQIVTDKTLDYLLECKFFVLSGNIVNFT